jgi:hypothetical protein
MPLGNGFCLKSNQTPSYIMTNGQLVSLSWCQAPGWDLHPVSLIISYRYVDVAPSLMRDRVCTFHLLLGLASAVFLGSESCGTHDNLILSDFETLATCGPDWPSYTSRLYLPHIRSKSKLCYKRWLVCQSPRLIFPFHGNYL